MRWHESDASFRALYHLVSWFLRRMVYAIGVDQGNGDARLRLHVLDATERMPFMACVQIN